MTRYSTPEARRKHAEASKRYRLAHPEAVAASQKKCGKKRAEKELSVKRKWQQRQHRYFKRRIDAYKTKFPERYHAHHAVANALRNGSLIRPFHCSSCLLECKPQAHHEDYAKPLEVIWLCRPCHLAIAGREPRVRRPGDPETEGIKSQ
jgi:hypothetical protein